MPRMEMRLLKGLILALIFSAGVRMAISEASRMLACWMASSVKTLTVTAMSCRLSACLVAVTMTSSNTPAWASAPQLHRESAATSGRSVCMVAVLALFCNYGIHCAIL